MKKLLVIGLIVMLVALAACSTYEEPVVEEKGSTGTTETVETGDPVLDNIENIPEEIVDEELDTLMDDVSMEDW